MTEQPVLPDLINGGWRDARFVPFRDGVEICDLCTDGSHVALLRYAPGASVPQHRHTGLETVIVLDGAQSDERGEYRAGACVFNLPGTEHSVWSPTGCVVLIQWVEPVTFVDCERPIA